MVAYSWGRTNVKRGDAIVLTEMEHHSNLVPWQILAQQTGAQLALRAGYADDGRLDLRSLDTLLDGAKIFAFTAVSNTLGTDQPRESSSPRERGAPGRSASSTPARPCRACQSTSADWGCDFAAFSAHKMLGPTGIGILWGSKELLDAMPPFLSGAA